MTRTSALDKVLKLLAKANGTNNVEEAATFAAKARELILKHNLDEAELERLGKATKPGYTHEILGTCLETWKQQLGFILGPANFCKIVRTKVVNRNTKQGYDMVLDCIGQPENLEVVKYLWTYLRREIDRLANKSWKDASWEDKRSTTWGPWWNSFCLGAVAAISERLARAEREEQAAPEHDQIMALIVVKGAELKEATKQFYPSLSTVKARKQFVESRVRDMGYQAGKALPLHKALKEAN